MLTILFNQGWLPVSGVVTAPGGSSAKTGERSRLLNEQAIARKRWLDLEAERDDAEFMEMSTMLIELL